MIFKSYAKINLSLRILKKLRNGLHDIETNFFLIDLHDKIRLKRINNSKDNIKFKGRFSKFIDNKKNSITKAIDILRNKQINKKKRYEIIIEKNIPVFSGLGGGTSNAVFLTKNLYNRKLDKKLIEKMEKVIGSDFRLFLYKQGYLKNLKNIKQYKRKFKLTFLIIYPNVKCSTKYIYSKVKKNSKPSSFNYMKITNFLKIKEAFKKDQNDLQRIAEKKYRPIKKIISFLEKQENCYLSRMTGSGSACYGLFKTKKTAKVIQKKIKKMFPKYWTAISRTI